VELKERLARGFALAGLVMLMKWIWIVVLIVAVRRGLGIEVSVQQAELPALGVALMSLLVILAVRANRD